MNNNLIERYAMTKKIITINAGPRKGWNTDTLFDPNSKYRRHETVFPLECRKVYEMGAALVNR